MLWAYLCSCTAGMCPWAATLPGLVREGGPGLLTTGRENFKESLNVGGSQLMEMGILFLITDAAAQYWRRSCIPNVIFFD